MKKTFLLLAVIILALCAGCSNDTPSQSTAAGNTPAQSSSGGNTSDSPVSTDAVGTPESVDANTITFGSTFRYEGFEVTIADSWSNHSRYEGFFSVPISTKNISNSQDFLAPIMRFWSPDGVTIEGGIPDNPTIRAGASFDTEFFFADRGDGFYVIEFTGVFVNSPVAVKIELPITRSATSQQPGGSVSSGAGTANPGEILYDGVPIMSLLGSRLADLRGILGNPDFEGVVWEGGTYGYRYDIFGDFDGIVFNKSEQGEHIEAIWGNPAALTFNGTTLNMDRDGLVSLLGNPEDENWIEDYGIETYFILYINPEGIAISFRLNSPNDRAHEFFISRY